MPAPLTSSTKQNSASVSRSRVVDVVQRIAAQGFAVTTAGDLVAVHCYTARGTVIVTGPLVAFVGAARAERDANGRPFAEKTSNRAVMEADAAEARALAPVPLPEPVPAAAAEAAVQPSCKRGWSRMTPERQARIDAAARRVLAGELPHAQAAREIGEPVSYLHTAAGRLRRESRAVLKPNGKIL